MFSHDFSHVSRCSEHVRFSGACTEAKVISTAGVFGDYFLTGLQADILCGHDTRKGSIGDNKRFLRGWQKADPVAYKLKLAFPFHALCCRKIQETVDIIPSAPNPAEVRSKI